MKHSDYVAGFLNPKTQQAYAESKQGKSSTGREDTPLLEDDLRKKLVAEYGPGLLAKDAQTRIHNLIFGSTVKTLDDAKRLHQMLIESLDNDAAQQKPKVRALFEAIESAYE